MEDSWAVGLFNSAVLGTPHQRVHSLKVNPTYINSPDAPRWVKLEGGDGWEIANPAQNEEVWATNWSRDLLNAAGQSLKLANQPSLELLRASSMAGGESSETPGLEHDGGIHLDIDTVAYEQTAAPFYGTQTIGDVRYIRAKTTSDLTGQTHVVHRIVGAQSHTSGASTTTIQLDATEY